MTTTVLTSRQTKMIDLLDSIAAANGVGEQPTKADLIGHVPNKTRANQYRMIDGLIRHGLVVDAGSGNRYALQVTDAGLAELAAHR